MSAPSTHGDLRTDLLLIENIVRTQPMPSPPNENWGNWQVLGYVLRRLVCVIDGNVDTALTPTRWVPPPAHVLDMLVEFTYRQYRMSLMRGDLPLLVCQPWDRTRKVMHDLRTAAGDAHLALGLDTRIEN